MCRRSRIEPPPTNATFPRQFKPPAPAEGAEQIAHELLGLLFPSRATAGVCLGCFLIRIASISASSTKGPTALTLDPSLVVEQDHAISRGSQVSAPSPFFDPDVVGGKASISNTRAFGSCLKPTERWPPLLQDCGKREAFSITMGRAFPIKIKLIVPRPESTG